jgi:hypothetical protein
MKLSKATSKTVLAWGAETCILAYYMNVAQGEGAGIISFLANGNYSTGNALINAGREIVTGSRK